MNTNYKILNIDEYFDFPPIFWKAIGVLEVKRFASQKKSSMPYVLRSSVFFGKSGGYNKGKGLYVIPYYSKQDRDFKISGILDAARGSDVYIRRMTMKQYKEEGLIYRYLGENNE